MNRVCEARAFLEAQEEGAFEQVCDAAMACGGVLVMMPECFLAAAPVRDEPEVLHVIFQCSELPTLYRVLCALPYEVVEWRRDFGHSEQYGTRRRRIADWGRKLGLAEQLNRKNDL